MKILKVIGIVIVVFVVLFFGIAMFLPSEIHVERSLVIPASSEVVFNQINDLRKWNKWSPWHLKDPNMKITYGDYYAGEQATYRWKSNKLGDGKLTITKSQPFQYIETEMDFMEEGNAIGYYQFEPVKEGTQVTWAFETNMGDGLVEKYVGLMMDSMVGSDFEKGLQNLKAYVQTLPENPITTEASSQKRNS